MTDPTLLRRAIESVGIEKPSDYTLVLEEVERLMDEIPDDVMTAANAALSREHSRHWEHYDDVCEIIARAILDDRKRGATRPAGVADIYENRLGRSGDVGLNETPPRMPTIEEAAEDAIREWHDRNKAISALIRAATDLVKEAEEMGFGKTSEKALPGSWDKFTLELSKVKGE